MNFVLHCANSSGLTTQTPGEGTLRGDLGVSILVELKVSKTFGSSAGKDKP